MVYGTEWNPRSPDRCQEEAENKAQRMFKDAPFFGFAFRFDDVSYAGPLDQYDQPTPGRECVELTAFVITKVTPKGFWINRYGISKGRFILLTANRKYACMTIAAAKESFVARKKRQIEIYQARVNKAQRAISSLHGVTIGSFC